MADFLSKETRSRVMARIRSRDTKPELALRRALHAAGVRGWRLHRRDLPGRPDLAFGPARLAVFVDGAFWHGHPDYFTPGKSGAYWDAKMARNTIDPSCLPAFENGGHGTPPARRSASPR